MSSHDIVVRRARLLFLRRKIGIARYMYQIRLRSYPFGLVAPVACPRPFAIWAETRRRRPLNFDPAAP